jgi:hypothetical protein
MKAADTFYEQQDEPIRSCLLALKTIILQQDSNVSAEWKYGMPFFCYKGKMFCYLWVHKKYGQPYIGIVEGKYFTESFLIQEERSRMKIMLIAPHKNLPVKNITRIIQKSLDLYRAGTVPIKNKK